MRSCAGLGTLSRSGDVEPNDCVLPPPQRPLGVTPSAGSDPLLTLHELMPSLCGSRGGSMTDVNDKLVAAWLGASKDLEIAVTAPYRVVASGEELLLCEAFLPDFGSPTGALAVSPRSRRKAGPFARGEPLVLGTGRQLLPI